MEFITIAVAVVAFAAGGAAYYFKTAVEKWYASKKRRPFFKVFMEYDHSNTNGVESMVNGVYPVEININADFNEEFVQRLDSYYISKEIFLFFNKNFITIIIDWLEFPIHDIS